MQHNTRKRPTSGLMGNIEEVLGVVKKSAELGDFLLEAHFVLSFSFELFDNV